MKLNYWQKIFHAVVWEFDSTTCNSNQNWNNDKCQCECKKCCTCKKDYSWNPSTCLCENSRYLENIQQFSNSMQWNYKCHG